MRNSKNTHMDHDVLRQRKESAGPLFHDNSVGSLPHGDIVLRKDTLVVTSPVQVGSFEIGAKARTAEIGSSVMLKGLAEYKKREDSTAAPKNSFLGEKLTTVQNADFTGQSVLNPSNRIA